MSHEELLIKSFVLPTKQGRYLNLIGTKKGREKFRTYIAHFNDLNAKYCIPLITIKGYSELTNLLVSKGADTTCYVISENSTYDMNVLALEDANYKLFDSGIGYFLSLEPGKLVYYEGEGPNNKFLLQFF